MPKPTLIKEITKEQFKELKSINMQNSFKYITVTKQKANNFIGQGRTFAKNYGKEFTFNWYEVIN